MRIGVLSDTHLGATSDTGKLAKAIERHFAGCEMILHAGDITSLDPFYELIPQGVRFLAVAGNMDQSGPSSELPRRRLIEVDGARIGLTHGYGGPGDAAANAGKVFEGDDCDVIVFGHSHKPCNSIVGGVLMFNPGSATDRRSAKACSIGILEIDQGIRGKIIYLER